MNSEIYIVGLGGVGSILANTISRFIDSKQNNPIVKINLIDGDEYEIKNLSRQEFETFGNKSEAKCLELSKKFSYITFNSYPVYLDQSNIEKIIKNNSIVFAAVDNHKTRKLISKYAENLSNIIIISGGNELTNGNVQIFIRKEGKSITPSLTDYHSEIDNPRDKSPSEMSCEELSQSEPQLYFTNLMVAAHMCSSFYNVIENNKQNISEVYFDLLTMNSNSKVRLPKKKQGVLV